MHLIFMSSLNFLLSKNPRNSSAIATVFLNQKVQICHKSERLSEHLFFSAALALQNL
jgi:hypothetical protein